MKKILAMVLALVLCLSLCACGHPLSKDYQTEDELVAALEECFSEVHNDGVTVDERDKKVSEYIEALKNNTAIHHYFQESEAAVHLAHRLCTGVLNLYAFDIFDACNTDDWFYGIANQDPEDDDGWPLFFDAWYDNGHPTCESIADGIRDDFIDPLSVSVLGGWIGFKDPVDGFFEVPFRYRGIVEVRATNRLGAYITKEYVISGTFGGSVRIIEEYDRPFSLPFEVLEEMGAGGTFVLE